MLPRNRTYALRCPCDDVARNEPTESGTKCRFFFYCEPTPRPSSIGSAGRDWRLRWACTWPSPGSARSEEHTSELQSLMRISYAVFCLTKKKNSTIHYSLSNLPFNTHPT